jgi:long-chain acyl-CoA synthetase
VPDERRGEEVAVAVVLKPGTALDETDLRKHCASVMAKHKVPRFVWFMDQALPRNANGKFLRRELRDELARQTA